MIEFDNDDDNNDALMWYASLLKYTGKDDLNFVDYEQHIPANLIRLPQQEATHHNKNYVMADKLDWTKIFEDTSYQAIPDMTSIKYRRERAEFDVNAIEEEIDNK